jgi:uncharacterized membrane protein
MKILLSTTALLLTLGFSSAALANSDWYGKEGQDVTPSYMERAICKLPKTDAAQFRDTMKEAREANKPLQEQVEKLHGDLHAILTADIFNKDTFIAKRNDIQQLHDKMEANMTEAFASAVANLNQEERVTLARALSHEHAKHHVMHKKTGNKYPQQPRSPVTDTTPNGAHQ